MNIESGHSAEGLGETYFSKAILLDESKERLTEPNN
jgi:hypothetical protein